ncbi:MAG: STAS domain-containing protein [Blastocatellia bacterium]|nr:STAS domain-containing protein [Blastocatellia bacterium]
MERTFTLVQQQFGSGTILYLDGALRLGHREAATGQPLSAAVRSVVASGSLQVAIDLRGLVKTPDSSGLGELVAAQSTLRRHGETLILVNVPPKLRTLIGSMGLDALFRIVDTEIEVHGLFGVEPTPE